MNHKRKNNKIPKIARVELKKLKLQLVFLLKHVRNASTKMINQFISNVRKFYNINGYLPSIDCTSFDTDPRFMISLGKRFDIEDNINNIDKNYIVVNKIRKEYWTSPDRSSTFDLSKNTMSAITKRIIHNHNKKKNNHD